MHWTAGGRTVAWLHFSQRTLLRCWLSRWPTSALGHQLLCGRRCSILVSVSGAVRGQRDIVEIGIAKVQRMAAW